MDLEAMIAGYARAALWSSNDESDERGGRPLDDNYDASDLADEARAAMRADCERFARDNAATLADAMGARNDSEQVGHDFWLTRNGHGAGFWDGDWPEPAGAALTESSKTFGEVHLYVGDDGRIHQSEG